MIICFTPAGFSRFTLSLSRFCGMNRNEALVLTNLCARANFDAFRAAAPGERRGEIRGLASFSLWNDGKPYQTEVQLYKAIQALLPNMEGGEHADTEAAAHLRALQNDLNEHCWNSYGLDMEDERTVYALCEPTLEPEAEPACVLLEDWKRLNNSKNGGDIENAVSAS